MEPPLLFFHALIQDTAMTNLDPFKKGPSAIFIISVERRAFYGK